MRYPVLFCLVAFACNQTALDGEQDAGGDGPSTEVPTSDCDVAQQDSYYPLVDGASWTYRHREGSEIRLETVTVEQIGDEYLLIDDATEGEVVEGRLQRRGCGVYRTHKLVTQDDEVVLEVDYDPGFLRMDDEELAAVGDELLLQYDRTAVSTDDFGDEQVERNCADCGADFPVREHRFTVEEVGADCEVGTDTLECIVVSRQRLENGVPGEVKRFWFARGVGKVREVDETSGKIEELLEFDLPGL